MGQESVKTTRGAFEQLAIRDASPAESRDRDRIVPDQLLNQVGGEVLIEK